MKSKVIVFTITIFLILSGLTVGVQGGLAGVENDEYDHDSSIDDLHSKNGGPEKSTLEYCENSILIRIESSDENLLKTFDNERFLQNQVEDLLNLVKGRTSRVYPSLNMAEIKLTEDIDVMTAIEILRRKEGIYAEPNYQIEVSNIPNDPGYDSLWAMDNIDAPGAWNVTTGSKEVVVPVIDTGIDYNHPDLKDNIWTSDQGHHGYNAVNDSYYPLDDNGHGTHIAGTIGAVGDNDMGVVGINWNVSLMGVKVLDSEGSGNLGDVISGLEYILEMKREGENIVATSNSWWGNSHSQLLYETIEKHLEEGILFVTAAGNRGQNNGVHPSYPANYDLPNVISVAATDKNDGLAGFSNYGRRSVHVGAPGVDINSTVLDAEYAHKNGTSMAVPHVSGLAALLASHNTSYDYNNLKNVILSSADSFDSLRNRTLIDGRINASNSIKQSPDPEDIQFWVHQPFVTTQWREKTRITISLNDGVNPIHGANVRVEFSTEEDPVNLVDDGSGMDQVANDGYYTAEWRPQTSGEVTLNITVQLEEFEEKLTKSITVDVSLVHRETAQRIVRGTFAFIRDFIDFLRNLLESLRGIVFSFESNYQIRKKYPQI